VDRSVLSLLLLNRERSCSDAENVKSVAGRRSKNSTAPPWHLSVSDEHDYPHREPSIDNREASIIQMKRDRQIHPFHLEDGKELPRKSTTMALE
jgi:hypothetical protein